MIRRPCLAPDGGTGQCKLAPLTPALLLICLAMPLPLSLSHAFAASSWGLSEVFISCILIPIAGNAAEHVSNCRVVGAVALG